MDVASAVSAVIQAGLVPNVLWQVSETVAVGVVISQVPAAGQVVLANTVVTLNVSNGAGGTLGTTTVPNVVGKLWGDASTALQVAQVSLDKYVWVANVAPAGSVVSQTPAAGTVVVPGTKVQLTLSAGAARVPPVVTVPVAS